MQSKQIKAWALASTLLTGLGVSAPAIAQDAEGASDDVVQVTGTRIRNANLTANSPITQVDALEFELTGTTRVEDLLRTLPQVEPSLDGFTVNPSTGAASVDLRGLGSSRTLVLVNGRRMPSANHNTTAPDLGTIPAPLVDRVEILTGGASAVYGADAVAGVVNFIIDKKFEGVKVSAGLSGYQHNNDNKEIQAINKARGFDVPTGSSNIDGITYDMDIAVGSEFAGGRGHASGFMAYRKNEAQFLGDRDYSNCALNSTSTGCGGSSTAPVPNFLVVGDTASGPLNFDWASYDSSGTFSATFGDLYNYQPINFLQRPDERWTAGSFISYDVSPSFRPYLESQFTNVKTDTQIAQTGTFYADALGFECDDPVIGNFCSDLGIIPKAGDDNNDVTIYVGKRNTEGGARSWSQDTTTWRYVVGAEGDFNSDNWFGEGWYYDVSATMGVTSVSEVGSNDFIRSRVSQAIRGCPAGSFAGCLPYNVFTPGGVTKEAAAAVAGTSVQSGRMEVFVLSAYTGGEVFSLPGASQAVNLVVGAEYREEAYMRTADSLTQAGGFTGSTAAPPVDGSYDVWEAYAESIIPIISGQEFIQDLSLEVGGRYSTYSSAGETVSYKIMGNWAPINELRFRGGYNRAVRAPNIVDLFLPQNGGLWGGSDPCAGANPTRSAADCARTGVTAAQYGNISDNPAAQYNQISGGNPNLEPEEADTYTIGLVYSPLDNLNISLDYYDIQISNSIGTLGASNILNTCLDTGESSVCSLVNRNPNGGDLWVGSIDNPANPGAVGYIFNARSNFERDEGVKGIDLKVSYAGEVPQVGGNFSASINATYNLERLFDGTDCSGVISSECSDPEYQHSARFIYDRDTFWSASIGWRHIGALVHPTLTSTRGNRVKSYDYMDLSGSFDVKDNAKLTIGVNNLFDKAPPIVPTSLAELGQSLLGYDQAGRYLFSSITLSY